MKKILMIVALAAIFFSGCSEKSKIKIQFSKEADEMNELRTITLEKSVDLSTKTVNYYETPPNIDTEGKIEED